MPCFCLLGFGWHWHSQLDPIDLFLNVTLIHFVFIVQRLGPVHHTFEMVAVPDRFSWVYFIEGFKSVGSDWPIQRSVVLSCDGALELAIRALID